MARYGARIADTHVAVGGRARLAGPHPLAYRALAVETRGGVAGVGLHSCLLQRCAVLL